MSRDLEDGHGAVGSVIAAGGEAAEVAVGGSGGKAGDAHDNDVVMPGFRFHPTEEELIEFYLRRKVEGKRFNVELIAFLDLYRFDPWELPGNHHQLIITHASASFVLCLNRTESRPILAN